MKLTKKEIRREILDLSYLGLTTNDIRGYFEFYNFEIEEEEETKSKTNRRLINSNRKK